MALLLTSDEERLYRVAIFQRSKFFRIWNELRSQEDREFRLSDLLEEALGHLPTETRPSLPLPPDVRFVSLLDAEYPKEFLQLPQPPLGIFVSGHLNSQKRVSIIGSRKPSSYALRLTREMSLQFVKLGFQIVSGGAIGIDSLAHEVAVRERQPTVVVMGSGFRHLYPVKNERLFHQVLETGGAWISEYHPFQEPRAYHFPERNRLIAALGHICFLAQAHEKSGSLLTARTALELGREVYVLRPVAGDAMFEGSRQLIEQGAKALITSAQLREDPLLDLYTAKLPLQSETDIPLQSYQRSHSHRPWKTEES